MNKNYNEDNFSPEEPLDFSTVKIADIAILLRRGRRDRTTVWYEVVLAGDRVSEETGLSLSPGSKIYAYKRISEECYLFSSSRYNYFVITANEVLGVLEGQDPFSPDSED